VTPALLLPDRILAELSAIAQFAKGGAILITPTGDIALVRGDVTPDGAHIARTNARRARTSMDETASFVCDDGSSVCLLAITQGWVLGVQARDRPDHPDLAKLDDEHREWVKHASADIKWSGLKVLLRCARDSLSQWLGYMHLPPTGGHRSGHGGAPAEAFAELPRKRLS